MIPVTRPIQSHPRDSGKVLRTSVSLCLPGLSQKHSQGQGVKQMPTGARQTKKQGRWACSGPGGPSIQGARPRWPVQQPQGKVDSAVRPSCFPRDIRNPDFYVKF